MSFQYVSLFRNNIIELLDTSGSSTLIGVTPGTGSGGSRYRAVATQATRTFAIYNYGSMEDARNALAVYLLAEAGTGLPTHDGLPLQSIDVSSDGNETTWRATASYGINSSEQDAIVKGLLTNCYQLPKIRDDQVSYSSYTENHTMYEGWEHLWSMRPFDSSTVQDYNGLINVNGNGVQGFNTVDQGTTITIAFLVPKNWLYQDVVIPSDDWLVWEQSARLGGQTLSRLSVIERLVGTVNYSDWGANAWTQGCVKFDNWSIQPTYFNMRQNQNDGLQDWYYSINMNFISKVPGQWTDNDGTLYYYNGWDYWWLSDVYQYNDGSTATAGYDQVNCDRVCGYGNWKYLGFNWAGNLGGSDD